jgi:hypothetical protein
MKWLSLAIIRELGGKYSFDVLGVSGEDATTTSRGSFDGITGSI